MTKFYDQALEILKEAFNQGTFTESKAKSSAQLFSLLQAEPSGENDIRMAILHFYNQHGLGCFIHKDKKTLHIITRIKNRTNNIYTQHLRRFLKTQQALIPQNREPNQEGIKAIFDFINTTFDINEEATKRELIKTTLRQTFGMETRDALFFKDGTIKLYKFDYEIVKINNEIRQIKSNTHLNSLSNEDRKFIDEALKSTDIHTLIINNTLEILSKDIQITLVDNLTFHQQFSFFAIQKLRIYLESLISDHVDSLGKSIYCVDMAQKYAGVMFETIAKELLDLCAKGNQHILSFIGFYNGGTINLKGKILQKPFIADNNGNPWTITRIQDCLRRKKSVDFDTQQMQKKLTIIDEKLHAIDELIHDNTLEQEELTQREAYYQQLYDEKNKALRESVDSKRSKEFIKTLSDETKSLILDKGQILKNTESIQTNLLSLANERIALLQEQNQLKEQIAYTFKKNKHQFLEYDLLSRAIADAIADAKELIL